MTFISEINSFVKPSQPRSVRKGGRKSKRRSSVGKAEGTENETDSMLEEWETSIIAYLYLVGPVPFSPSGGQARRRSGPGPNRYNPLPRPAESST